MNPILFGSGAPPNPNKRPVICCDCDAKVVAGGGEPTYTVCRSCCTRRGNREMQRRRDINHAFDPKSGYRRRKKK